MVVQDATLIAGLAAGVLALSGCGRAQASDGRSGADLFRAACARCHGVEGTGGPPPGPGQPPPRNLTDAAFQGSRSDADLVAAIKRGKGKNMPPFAAVYDDGEIARLVAHIRSLRRISR